MDYYDQLKPAIDTLTKLIKKYKTTKNIEIELKIGRIEDGRFQVGLNSEEFYNKIKKKLDSYDKWKKVNSTTTKDYISGNYKKTDSIIMCKKRLENVNFSFNGTPYDFRISVCTETPVKLNSFKSDIVRNKNRTSYVYKECNYDITKVTEETKDELIENEEFEIELTHLNSKTADKYRAHSALLKLRDIINMCEKISNDASVIKMV